ncbi:MAG: hypothetical protein P4L46_19195 [Fimbriimonas sp.]|nr:hypothetical protein [Fimbriimonas sp.]
MFPGAQEFKNKVMWICRPGESKIEFTVLRPLIYLRPISEEHPVVAWRIAFTIPKADTERFQSLLAECDSRLRFIFESPSATYQGEGEVHGGPKPYIAYPEDNSGLTRIPDLVGALRSERESLST